MKSIKQCIIIHQVTAFFILTYSISWPLFIITLFILPGNMALQGTLGTIAVFAPVLSGIIISGKTQNNPPKKPESNRPVAFLLAWFFSILILILFIWQVRGAQIQIGMIIFCGILALLPAYILSGAFSKNAGVRDYLETLIKPKGPVIWYLIAIFTFPIIQLAGYCLSIIVGQEVGEIIRGGFSSHTIILILLTFLYGFLFTGGINEESGWRGFAIPKLHKQFSPLIASVIVWFFWALWHLLYDIAGGDSVSSILMNRLVFNFLWAILFVWVFNRTKGSILAPALFHPAMNTFGEFLPRTDAATVLFVVLTVYVVISDKMWVKLSDNISRKDQKG